MFRCLMCHFLCHAVIFNGVAELIHPILLNKDMSLFWNDKVKASTDWSGMGSFFMGCNFLKQKHACFILDDLCANIFSSIFSFIMLLNLYQNWCLVILKICCELSVVYIPVLFLWFFFIITSLLVTSLHSTFRI